MSQSWVTVDGTDCLIQEPTPFSSVWWSHKSNSAAVRYELAISVRSGRVVWANGPFPAGIYSDSRIFKNGLKQHLGKFEFVITDAGYFDTRCIVPPPQSHPMAHIYSVLRSRHETANGRLKRFDVLRNKFRHNPNLHVYCFYAVLNIVHLDMEASPLFTVSNL